MNIAAKLHDLLHHSWSYAEANALYQEIGTCEMSKFMFSTGENSFNSDRLRTALEELEPSFPFTVQRRIQVEEHLPDDVLEIEKEWKDLYKISNHLRFELFKRDDEGNYINQEKLRGELAHQILSNFDDITRMWGAVDYFREHGHIPPTFDKVQLDDTDPLAMHKRLKNLRTYISNARSGRKKYKQTIEEMTAELAELERRLA